MYCHHRDLNLLTHSFPTPRSSDLGTYQVSLCLIIMVIMRRGYIYVVYIYTLLTFVFLPYFIRNYYHLLNRKCITRSPQVTVNKEDRTSKRLNSSNKCESRMPSSA